MKLLESLRSAIGFALAPWLVIAGLAFASVASAQQPITYQGQLQQSGAPFTGFADLEFQLYDSLNGGTQIGSMLARPAWPVEDGLFQVELDFGGGSFGADPRWLQITVDGTTLVPRQRVYAAPMAMFALAGNEGPPGADGAPGPPGADGAEGPPGDSHWIINGTATAYLDGPVGIGTATPAASLHVQGNSSISIPQAYLVEQEDDYARLSFGNTVSDRFWSLAGLTRGDDVALDSFNLFHSTSGNLLQINGTGSIGIGGNPPLSAYRLNVGEGLLVSRDAGAGTGTIAHLALVESSGPEPVRQLFWNSSASRGWRIDSVVDADPANERWSLSTTGTGVNADVLSVLGSRAVGIGYPAPPAALTVRSRNAWTWNSGNKRGDFYIGDGVVGLSMGVALSGGGYGVSRIWTNGGVEHLFIGSAGYGTSMSILPGQVGINTDGPTATLDVAGNARVRGLGHIDSAPRPIRADNNGNLVIDPVEDWVMVPFEAFGPNQDSTGYSKTNGLTGMTGFGVFHAPVALPHGAEITEVSTWFRDDSAASDLRVALCRRSLVNTFFTCQLMAELRSTGASPDTRSLSVTGVGVPVIDNQNHSYYLTVSTTSGWAGFTTALASVRIGLLRR